MSDRIRFFIEDADLPDGITGVEPDTKYLLFGKGSELSNCTPLSTAGLSTFGVPVSIASGAGVDLYVFEGGQYNPPTDVVPDFYEAGYTSTFYRRYDTRRTNNGLYATLYYVDPEDNKRKRRIEINLMLTHPEIDTQNISPALPGSNSSFYSIFAHYANAAFYSDILGKFVIPFNVYPINCDYQREAPKIGLKKLVLIDPATGDTELKTLGAPQWLAGEVGPEGDYYFDGQEGNWDQTNVVTIAGKAHYVSTRSGLIWDLTDVTPVIPVGALRQSNHNPYSWGDYSNATDGGGYTTSYPQPNGIFREPMRKSVYQNADGDIICTLPKNNGGSVFRYMKATQTQMQTHGDQGTKVDVDLYGAHPSMPSNQQTYFPVYGSNTSNNVSTVTGGEGYSTMLPGTNILLAYYLDYSGGYSNGYKWYVSAIDTSDGTLKDTVQLSPWDNGQFNWHNGTSSIQAYSATEATIVGAHVNGGSSSERTTIMRKITWNPGTETLTESIKDYENQHPWGFSCWAQPWQSPVNAEENYILPRQWYFVPMNTPTDLDTGVQDFTKAHPNLSPEKDVSEHSWLGSSLDDLSFDAAFPALYMPPSKTEKNLSVKSVTVLTSKWLSGADEGSVPEKNTMLHIVGEDPEELPGNKPTENKGKGGNKYYVTGYSYTPGMTVSCTVNGPGSIVQLSNETELADLAASPAEDPDFR